MLVAFTTLIPTIHKFENKMQNQMGYIYSLCACLTFYINGVLIKSIQNVPSSQMVFFRSMWLMLINSTAMRHYGIKFYAESATLNRQLHFRGIIGICSLAAFMYGIILIPLSEGMVLRLTSPAITGVLARFLLNEPYEKIQGVTTIMSFFLESYLS